MPSPRTITSIEETPFQYCAGRPVGAQGTQQHVELADHPCQNQASVGACANRLTGPTKGPARKRKMELISCQSAIAQAY